MAVPPADRRGHPTHAQPGLLAEAIGSVLDQEGAPPAAAVVVDDGCPFPETRAVASAFAAAHPGRVFALHRPNGGLSAARNTGVAFALSAFPALEAVYFLDSDNRLHPPFLARAHAALAAAPPGIGWVYPDFDRFGVAVVESSVPWSLLAGLSENLCEAGSLVRRAVFDAGVRFAEPLRAGFEDWDFWLSAAEAGFRGLYLPDAGFRYRRRPESMLSEAERQRAALLPALRARHPRLYSPRSLLALEAEEAPRHAVFDTAAGAEVRLVQDPGQPGAATEVLEAAAARRRLLEAEAAPAAAFFPRMLVFAAAETLELLAAARLARGLFWQAERLLRLDRAEAVAVDVLPAPRASAPDEAAVTLLPAEAARGGCAGAAVILASRRLLAEAAAPEARPGRLDSLGTERPLPRLRRLRVTLPRDLPPPPRAAAEPDGAPPLRRLLLEAALLREARRRRGALGGGGGGGGGWRGTFLSARDEAARRAGAMIGLGTTLPWRPRPGERAVGFAVPLFTLGGVERVVLNQAAVLKRRGWRTHLAVLGGGDRAALPAAAREAFDDVALIPGRAFQGADWRHPYLGAETAALDGEEAADALGLLAGLDAVIATHSLGAHALAARLRKLGTRCYASMHLVERGPWGQPIGTPHSALAYEHAYDGALVISEGLRDWCLGQGWPAAKLHLLRNAPGYPVGPAKVAAALAARAARHGGGGRLRALFLGRLDAQKGVDRLAAVIAATRGAVDWRVAGRAVLEDGAPPPDLGLEVEPPVSAPAALDALYGWADVLVLPSRFEGVPLVVLEAQRLGVAVLATDAGETAEAVADGADGILVRQGDGRPDGAVVAGMVAALRRLDADRALLLELGRRAAARVAAEGDWEGRMAGFLDHLDRVVPAREGRP